MRPRRWLGMAAVLAVVAAVSALGGVQFARSQAPFAEGAFVVGSDGARWVVGGGARYRMTFVTDDAGLLAGMREGSAVATVAEAQAALAGGQPVAAPPAPANPAESLIGQTVRACNYNVEFDITVAGVEWLKSVIGNVAPGNGMWIVALIDVTNASTKAEALTTRPLQLRDRAGREFNVREYPPDPVDLGRAYNVKGSYTNFEPGITERTVVTFQAPDNVGPLTLVGKRDFC